MKRTPEDRTRFIGGLLIFLMGCWVLRSFFPLLAWVVILVITTWPIYQLMLTHSKEQHGKMTWSAVILTLLIATIIVAPMGYGLSRLTDDAQAFGQMLNQMQDIGIPPPSWLDTLPVIGHTLKDSWLNALGSPEAAKTSLHGLGTSNVIGQTKNFAGQLLNHILTFLFVMLVLPFVYQHGESLSRQILATCNKLFGANTGSRYACHAAAALRGTVNGMLLIGIAKGLLLGVGYAAAGLSHPALLGALTGMFALIPFAAKIIFGGCSVVLAAQGNIGEAIGLFSYGMVLTLITDNYVRPVLIGSAVKLPFIWTLLGIFGGMEAFGLLGLFLGPTILAVLMSIWRDWLKEMEKP